MVPLPVGYPITFGMGFLWELPSGVFQQFAIENMDHL